MTNRFDGTVSRIDPDSGEVVETIAVGLDPRGIAIGFGSVWVALAGSNTVVRIDPETNEVTQPIGVGNAPGSLAVSADAVWVVNTLDDTVSRIEPDTNSVVDTIAVGDDPAEIAVAGGIVWVANEADGTLSRIEPGQSSASSTVIESVPQGMAPVGSDLWVSVRDTSTSHRGGTLRVLGNFRPESLDPTARMTPLRGASCICSGTVSWRSSRSVASAPSSFPIWPSRYRCRPTGARGTPSSSARGSRTRTVRRLQPVDFRRGIERVFRLGASRSSLFRGLVGGEACHDEPRTCDLSRGIETDDDRDGTRSRSTWSNQTRSSSTSSPRRCLSGSTLRPGHRADPRPASPAPVRTAWKRR